MNSGAQTFQIEGVTAEIGTVIHEGREYSAGGAVVTPEYLICYPNDRGEVCDWAGKVLGTYRTISSRPAIFFGHHSWQGTNFYYMRAKVDGRSYSIRGFGAGMVAKGKAIKG